MESLFTLLTRYHWCQQRGIQVTVRGRELRAVMTLKSTGSFLLWNSKTVQKHKRRNLPLNLLQSQQGTVIFKSGHKLHLAKPQVPLWTIRTGEVGSVHGRVGPEAATCWSVLPKGTEMPAHLMAWKLWSSNGSASPCSQGVHRECGVCSGMDFPQGPQQVEWAPANHARRMSWWRSKHVAM